MTDQGGLAAVVSRLRLKPEAGTASSQAASWP